MSVAVVIPTWNNEKYLVRCLETLFDLTKHVEYRAIVVDNGSTDGTWAYLQNIKGRVKNLTAIHSDTNLGFIGGNNLAFKELKPQEHVLLLNDDTQIVSNSWLAQLEATFDEGKDIGAVGPTSNFTAGLQNAVLSSQLPDLHEVKFLTGFCLLVRDEAFAKAGLFLDSRFGVNQFEDYDLCLRIAKAGYKLMVNRNVFVLHYGSRTTSQVGEEKFKAQLAEGQRTLVDKWGVEEWQDIQMMPKSLKEWVDRNKAEPAAVSPGEPNGEWGKAYKVLHPLATSDYPGGAWPKIRYEKMKALYELATQVSDGVIVELGTFRGLGAIAMALGAGPNNGKMVYTIDHKTDPAFAENLVKADMVGAVQGVIDDVREAASKMPLRVGLLFWDLDDDRSAPDDVRAWQDKVVPGGIVAVKETGRDFNARDWLSNQPGWEPGPEYPEGLIFTARKSLPRIGTALYIVSEDAKYLAEAATSAARVRSAMPGVEPVCIGAKGTEGNWYSRQVFTLCEFLKNRPDGEKVIWFDSDTYLVEPVPELFEMLDRYELVLAHAPGHRTAPTFDAIPDAFPEFQIGVIGMRNNVLTREVWQHVYEKLAKHPEMTDQAALREELWENGVFPYAVIPCEYNFRFHFGGQVRDKVKILHGRGGNYEEIARLCNEGYVEGYQVPPRIIIPK